MAAFSLEMRQASVATTAATVESIDDLPHDDYGPQLNFTTWLLIGLSGAFLSLRIYCKFLRHRGLWWDDYILIVSWVWPPA